jgi:chemotaxis protein histidine kinase CheA
VLGRGDVWLMVGGGKLEGTEDERNGIRLMLVSAHGCRICVALDAVEGIFDVGAGAAAASTATLAHGTTVPLVDWGDVTGVGAGAEEPSGQIMVLHTPAGPVGLRIDACLGMRSVSLARTPPMPTRLRDANGGPLCFLLMLDGRPHLMLEPRGLVTRLSATPLHDGGGASMEVAAS